MKRTLCMLLAATALASGCGMSHQRQVARNAQLNEDFFMERVTETKDAARESYDLVVKALKKRFAAR